jgi:chromate transporter
LHTLFGGTTVISDGPLALEVPSGDVQWAALGITVLGFALIFGRGWSVLRTLGVCAVVGLSLGLAGLGG